MWEKTPFFVLKITLLSPAKSRLKRPHEVGLLAIWRKGVNTGIIVQT